MQEKEETKIKFATAIIFLTVAITAIIGMITINKEEYNFPTGDFTRKCIDHTECGLLAWCENIAGGDGGIDGRRGHRCRARFVEGVSCYENAHCRSNYCRFVPGDDNGFCATPNPN